MSKLGPQRRATDKKPSYSIGDELREYLARFNRDMELPVRYSQLLHWDEAMPLYDKDGEDTLWLTVVYSPEKMKHFSRLEENLRHVENGWRSELYGSPLR
ncbi:hypothetical protein N9X40_01795 [bacterium]|nr:hypothetical protein [bacterium]